MCLQSAFACHGMVPRDRQKYYSYNSLSNFISDWSILTIFKNCVNPESLPCLNEFTSADLQRFPAIFLGDATRVVDRELII